MAEELTVLESSATDEGVEEITDSIDELQVDEDALTGTHVRSDLMDSAQTGSYMPRTERAAAGAAGSTSVASAHRAIERSSAAAARAFALRHVPHRASVVGACAASARSERGSGHAAGVEPARDRAARYARAPASPAFDGAAARGSDSRAGDRAARADRARRGAHARARRRRAEHAARARRSEAHRRHRTELRARAARRGHQQLQADRGVDPDDIESVALKLRIVSKRIVRDRWVESARQLVEDAAALEQLA